jgi:hypothetical protein
MSNLFAYQQLLAPGNVSPDEGIVELIIRSSGLSAISGSCMVADETEKPEGYVREILGAGFEKLAALLMLEKVNHTKGTER